MKKTIQPYDYVEDLPIRLDGAIGNEPTLTSKKLEILEKNEKFCFEKSGGMNNDTPPTDEQLYHLGAYHAFQDTLDMLYNDVLYNESGDEENEKRRLSTKTKLVITAAVITTGVYVAPKLERKFQLKERARRAKKFIVNEVNFIKGTIRG